MRTAVLWCVGFDRIRGLTYIFTQPKVSFIWSYIKHRDSFQYKLRNTVFVSGETTGELSYLAPLGSENISSPYFKLVFLCGGVTPPD